MADSSERRPIREATPCGRRVFEAQQGHAAVDGGVCAEPEPVGDGRRRRASARPLQRVKCLDLFAGCGRVAAAAVKAGAKAEAIDIVHGPEHDVTRPCVFKALAQHIADRELAAVMLAPPCTTFSHARRARVGGARTSWKTPRLSNLKYL